MIDTLVIKYDIDGDFEEDKFYEIEIDSKRCHHIISLDSGIKIEDKENFITELDGKKVISLYKGLSRLDGMKIFILSPKQIIRQIKLEQLL